MPRRKKSESPNDSRNLPEVDKTSRPTTEEQSAEQPSSEADGADGSEASAGAAPDFESIRIEEPDAGESIFEGDFEEVGRSDPTPPGCYTKDEFWDEFQAWHQAAGLMTGLQSLPIGDFDRGRAQAASDAIWDIAAESESLRFMIRKEGGWLKRMSAILGYGFVKVALVRAELQGRRASEKQPTDEPKHDET